MCANTPVDVAELIAGRLITTVRVVDCMLQKLSGLQSSDESHEVTEMSFSVETRDASTDELVKRTYTFSWGKEFEEWYLSEYKEERTPELVDVSERTWQKSRHVFWHEDEEIDVEVPQVVSDELARRMDADSVTIRI